MDENLSIEIDFLIFLMIWWDKFNVDGIYWLGINI